MATNKKIHILQGLADSWLFLTMLPVQTKYPQESAKVFKRHLALEAGYQLLEGIKIASVANLIYIQAES